MVVVPSFFILVSSPSSRPPYPSERSPGVVDGVQRRVGWIVYELFDEAFDGLINDH